VRTKFNCLVCGEAGTGKSPFAATLEHCEQTSPCLFLDVDIGFMSIVEEPKPTIVEISSWDTVGKIHGLLKAQNWSKLAEMIKAEPKEYRSVVIDSGTELEYILRQRVLSEDSSREIPEQTHYLKTQERFRRLYRAYRDLPLTFVMIAGVRELKDDISGVVRHSPDFQPALCKDIVRMTDIVLFQNVVIRDKKIFHTLQSHLSQRVVARDRSQTLEPLFEAEKLYFADIAKKVLI